MACNHSPKAFFRVYRRGPAPAYAFQPFGLACGKCSKLYPDPPAEARGIKEAKSD